MIFISIMVLIVAIALHSLPPVILSRISAIVFIYAGVLALNTFDIQAIGSGIGIYSGLFHVNAVTQLIDIFLFFIAALIIIASPYIQLNKIVSNNNSGQYSLIVLFSTLGASLLISSFDLISLYLCIELQSFGVYILATLYRNSESATSAGLKYFLLGSLSSCLILLGSGLIYAYTGLTNLESIYSLVSVTNSAEITQGFNIGIVIIFIGLLFKIPNWVKYLFSFILFILFLLKLFGFNDVFEYLNSSYYIFLFFKIGCVIVVLLELIDLIILNLFIKKKRQIPEVLPEFLINLLKGYEATSQNKTYLNYYKKGCYIQISLYSLLFMILIILT